MGQDTAAAPAIGDQVWTVPNIISMFRLVLIPVFAVLIFTERDIAAIVVLCVAGFTDWVDGVIARAFHQISRLGQLLDPAADRLYILVTLLGLAWRDFVPWWLVVVIVGRDVFLLGLMPILRRHGFGPLPVHLAGKAGTFALMYAFPLLLLGSLDGAAGEWAWIIGWACALWGVGLYWFAAFVYGEQTWRIVRRARSEKSARAAQVS